MRGKDKPRMNGFLRHLIMLRNRWNGVFARTKRLEHKEIRNSSRQLVKREIKNAKQSYYAKLKNTLSSGATKIKKFWSIMKQL